MAATGQRLEIAIISMSTGLNVKATQEPPQHNTHSLDMRTFFSSTALAH